MKRLRLHIPISLLLAALVLSSAASLTSAAAAPAASDLFTVTFHTSIGDFSYTDNLIEPTDYLVADEIAARNINAPLKVKRAMMSRAVRSDATYERAVTMCMPLIKQTVDRMESALYVPPEDAEMTFDTSAVRPFTIKREKAGRELDREKTFELIYISVMRGGGDSLSAPVREISPDVTAEELIAETYTRATFTTEFSTDNEDRAHNIALALSHIDGTVLEPGAEFSFNGVVGARSEANGFKQAKIISGGDYVLGWGGGVCQASTTLYNAALMAGMEITAVRNHSLAAGYVAPSLDAMVNSGSSDLKFRNPLDRPVYIAASALDGRAKVRIYGLKPEYRIVPKSIVLEHIAPPETEILTDTEHKYLPEDTPSGDSLCVRLPKEGLKSEAYLEYYRGTVLVRRIKIRSDYYRPLSGITAIAP